jgi:integrase
VGLISGAGQRGGNFVALQQTLGHASIETTQRYARLTDEAVMRESQRLVAAELVDSGARGA